ncbi:MAG TPA: 2-oxoacid:ferredoxin oxidoreductase subunit beta [Anaerolineae bacterium]|nr:MAG: 2-oxoglutarate oxidoreductase subunit KorB [Chloroflexi bacterium ADurb.Bin222]HOC22194.1 2-oxoacid:ferredoxin oxidoreductase subunit beta [Anaerolineae bacterium]HQM15127.1 2-oxoacid:ferredoxin oxidoreductase subunit beta [Anaerolineae bacterium]
MARKPNDYKNPVKPIWCPGCGDYAVHAALMRAFADLDLAPENIIVASGIGCSSRMPGFFATYGFHGIHGRVLPLATGIKLSQPDKTVIAVGGDGDGFSIGGGHVPHAARRNIEIAYIMMDNSIYGMTKGQASPTSPRGMKQAASPYGTVEDPLNPLLLALAYNTTFVARAFSGALKEMVEIFKQALQHPGFAFVQVLSPCVSFFNTYDLYRENTAPLPDNHDPTDMMAAMQLAQSESPLYLGIFRRVIRPGYSQQMAELQQGVPNIPPAELLERYKR